MKIPVSILMCTLILLGACATERIVEKPVPVEVFIVDYIEVPRDLTGGMAKQRVPDGLTYGEAIQLWSEDRATIDTLNGNMLAIRSLEQ